MRRLVVLLALGSACGFDTSGLAPGEVIRDDTASDFMAAGSSLDSAEIDDGGFITPTGWVTGAALAKGANSELFTDPATLDWTMLDATTPAGIAFAAPLGDYGGGAPIGVGVAQSDDFTMWISGEIWLEAGTHTFQLTADDNGLLDLAQPGSTTFTRVVTAQWFQAPQTATFIAGGDGWYPIHLAMSEGNGQASFVLLHQPPGGTLAPLDPDRLRVAAGDAHGVVADGFDDFYLMRPAGRSLVNGPMLEQQLGSTPPKDTGITQGTLYSFHWAAQVRVDLPGDYQLSYDTDDGQRLRVDGQIVLDTLGGHPVSMTTLPIHLDPGWHDVIAEMTVVNDPAHATLHVATGPDLVGGPFPLERVRPIVPRVDRVAGASDESDQGFPASGSTGYTMTPAVPAGATIAGVDFEYHVNVPHLNALQVSAIAPDGTAITLRKVGDPDHAGVSTEWRTTHALDGAQAAGPWQLVVSDLGGQSGGTLLDGAITVHYTGGHAPIATTASYDSQVRDLGATATIDEATYSASAPTGTGVAVRLRTGDTTDALMAQPWSDPIVSGAPPIVAPGRFLQYRVELSSDGDHSAAFDWIELVYRGN